MFIQNVMNALQWGSFYALIALGYSMVYGVLLLINFAHGDIFMVGAYIGFFISTFLLGAYAFQLPWKLSGGLVIFQYRFQQNPYGLPLLDYQSSFQIKLFSYFFGQI